MPFQISNLLKNYWSGLLTNSMRSSIPTNLHPRPPQALPRKAFPLVTKPHRIGGAREDRTPGLLRARQALSQLSYGPVFSLTTLSLDAFTTPSPQPSPSTSTPPLQVMVGLGRFERPTSPLSGVRSNQLSYRPSRVLACRSK